MNTTVNNKLLAEFSGAKNTFGNTDLLLHPNLLYVEGHGVVNVKRGQLLYHEKWEWLIPLLKIIKVKSNQINYKDMVGLEQRLNPFNYDLESIYNACVEFVKLYNAYMWSKLEDNTSL